MTEGGVQKRREALRRTVQEAFAAEDLGPLRLVLNDHHPADLADLFRHLDDEEQPVALQTLAEPLAADHDAQRRVVAAVFWDCGVFLVKVEVVAYLATGSKPVLRALLKDLQDHRRSSGILP